MDVKETDFFETETFDKTYFPLPESDYAADGTLRRVRKRMVKKLFAYEMKALFRPMLVVALILAAISVFLFVYGLTVKGDSESLGYWFLAFVPYIYAAGAMVFTPYIAASKRYKNHFFGNEGYLTFSIPASAEEQILAKRLSGLLAMLIGDVLAALSFLIAVLPFAARTGAFEGASIFRVLFSEMFQGNGVHVAFVCLELFIISVLGSILLFTVIGAWNCLRHRGVKRRTVFGVAIGVYIGIVVFESLALSFFDGGSGAALVFDSVAWVHISNCLQILLQVGLIWLCTRYEIRTLQYKLNLK